MSASTTRIMLPIGVGALGLNLKEMDDDFLRVTHLLSREEAFELIQSSTRRDHSILVSRVMRGLAKILGEDAEKWEVVGLLHDLDYDLVKGDMSKHGLAASTILKGRIPEDALHAVKAHDHRAGFRPQTTLDRSLIVADALAIFIEDQAIRDVEEKEALVSKLDEESVCKPWIRDAILAFCGEKRIELAELLRLGVEPGT